MVRSFTLRIMSGGNASHSYTVSYADIVTGAMTVINDNVPYSTLTGSAGFVVNLDDQLTNTVAVKSNSSSCTSAQTITIFFPTSTPAPTQTPTNTPTPTNTGTATATATATGTATATLTPSPSNTVRYMQARFIIAEIPPNLFKFGEIGGDPAPIMERDIWINPDEAQAMESNCNIALTRLYADQLGNPYVPDGSDLSDWFGLRGIFCRATGKRTIFKILADGSVDQNNIRVCP